MACVRSMRAVMQRSVLMMRRGHSDWAARATGRAPEKQKPIASGEIQGEDLPSGDEMMFMPAIDDVEPQGLTQPGVNHPAKAAEPDPHGKREESKAPYASTNVED